MNKVSWMVLLTVAFLGITPGLVCLDDTSVSNPTAVQETVGQVAEETTKEVVSLLTAEDIWKSVYREVVCEKTVSGEMILNLAMAEVANRDVELMTSSTDHIVSYHGRRFAITDDDYQVLLRIVEAEAPDEDLKGKMLVANVVLNRMEIGFGGDTISEVVFDDGQFEPVRNGRIFKVTISDATIEAVERVINGEDLSQGALYFMARDKASKRGIKWFDENLKFLFEHGGHEFFTEK